MQKQFIASFHKNQYGIGLMIISAIFVATAQLFWKISDSLLILFFGFILYAFAAIIMITAFRYGSLSVLHPIYSINYVFGLLLGYFLLKENISIYHLIGIVFIFIGILYIVSGD